MQDEQNPNSEYNNPANWYLGSIYYAPKDPNVIVPRRSGPEFGANLNFARGEAYLILATPLILSAIIMACVYFSL